MMQAEMYRQVDANGAWWEGPEGLFVGLVVVLALAFLMKGWRDGAPPPGEDEDE